MKEDSYQDILDELLPDISGDQRGRLLMYLDLLEKWNKIYNLTAIIDPRERVVKHILDSLSISPYLYGGRIIDVGTGAGLPGIPLAIMHSDKQFVLLDSNSKKTRFLKQTLLETGLENVEIIDKRAENYHPMHCFDTVMTRAFASIPDMLRLTRHLCCPDGVFLAMKGTHPADELNRIDDKFVINDVVALNVPELNAERCLVRIKFKGN